MANQLKHLLARWYPQRDQTDWVLGTVYKTSGPCYRKAGAMMLFSGYGGQYGLLSGGCLESDIQRHAKRVMQQQRSVLLCYDANDEDDLSFQLGIGCGGTVYILLQPVNQANHYLELERLYQALQQRESMIYRQLIAADGQVVVQLHPAPEFEPLPDKPDAQPNGRHSWLVTESADDAQWLVSHVRPEPHLLVVGGGVDAGPVINLAAELGWETSLWDSRPANARREYFPAADHIPACTVAALADYAREQRVTAAVIMSHNVSMDAQALAALQNTSIDYMALLGPTSRRHKVLAAAELTEADLQIPLSGPAGLDIGGELPESIALSIIAECHARLMKVP